MDLEKPSSATPEPQPYETKSYETKSYESKSYETKPAPRQQQDATPEGCLAVAIRIPVRIVVLVLVVPVRMVWDALVVGGGS